MSNESELIIREVYAYLRLHDTAAAIDFYSRQCASTQRIILAYRSAASEVDADSSGETETHAPRTVHSLNREATNRARRRRALVTLVH